jgi:nicotinamide mononucleotide (NMN) deamidase PncC
VSNYEEGFRTYKEVPENEKIKLTYDAIYIHEAESCSGGLFSEKMENLTGYNKNNFYHA